MKTYILSNYVSFFYFSGNIRSAIAGSIAAAITSPLDMIKLRLQVNDGKGLADHGGTHTSMGEGLVQVFRQEGLRGLFRGVGARVLFHTPNTAITMALFETCRLWWQSRLIRC